MRCSYCNKVILERLQLKEILWPWKLPEKKLCQDCCQLFQPLGTAGCRGCGKDCQEELCQDCQRWRQLYPDYDFQHRGLFRYDPQFKNFMQRYKFHGDLRMAEVFAPALKTALKDYHDYLICPIPLSAQRFEERGFNQVTALLTAAEIPFQMILEKRQDTLPQAKKKRSQRLASPQPFRLTATAPSLVDRKVLIVDDVYTTGRTIFHAVQLCRAAGAQKVRSFSLAR